MANVAQLAVMKSYEMLRAPFDGTVTARFVDVGALVQSSVTNQTSNQPVLTIADMSRSCASTCMSSRRTCRTSMSATWRTWRMAPMPTRKVRARIARTSEQLDPRTRTLFVELDVDNSEDFLVPGSFAYVTLHVPVPQLSGDPGRRP